MARCDAASLSGDSQPLLVDAWAMGGGGGNVGPDGGLGDGCTEEWWVTFELHFGPKKSGGAFLS